MLRLGLVLLLVAAVACSGIACGRTELPEGQPDDAATDSAPTMDAAPIDGADTNDAGADSASCMILASNYDQSCTLDTDCTNVHAGDYCSVPPLSSVICLCAASAINVAALAQFSEDISKTPLIQAIASRAACGCPSSAPAPCCRHGTCQGDPSACISPSDTLPACADAGGTCGLLGSCTKAGPENSCTYSMTEECCLPL
jgi:hypothetical protein